MAILVDEGSGLMEVWGQVSLPRVSESRLMFQLYATPAVGEKGYLDVEIRVETPGGHSSVPRESVASIEGCAKSSRTHRYRPHVTPHRSA